MPQALEEGGVRDRARLVDPSARRGLVDAAPRLGRGSGCDALLLHYDTEDPLTHTASWTRDRYADDPDGQEAMLERWLAYFDGLGIEGIGYGARRSAPPRRRRACTCSPTSCRRACGRPGAHIERLFAAADYLGALGDDRALLVGAARPASRRARVEQRVRLRAGRVVDRADRAAARPRVCASTRTSTR